MNKEKLPFEMPSFDLTGKVAVVTGGQRAWVMELLWLWLTTGQK